MAIQWSLVIFTALTGMAGWMFACVAIDKINGRNAEASFKAALIAAIVMLVGGIVSVTHLAHPENILRALNHPTSGIFTEALLVGLSLVFMIVFLILVKRNAGQGAQKTIAVVGALTGIILSFMAGVSYMMPAAGVWMSWLLPLGYMCTAIPAGAALYIVVIGKGSEQIDVSSSSMILAVGGILAGLVPVIYVLTCGASVSVGGLLYGGCLLCGGIVPAVCGFLMRKQPEKVRTLAIIALIGAFIGAISFRCIMWLIYTPTAVGAPYITDNSTL